MARTGRAFPSRPLISARQGLNASTPAVTFTTSDGLLLAAVPKSLDLATPVDTVSSRGALTTIGIQSLVASLSPTSVLPVMGRSVQTDSLSSSTILQVTSTATLAVYGNLTTILQSLFFQTLISNVHLGDNETLILVQVFMLKDLLAPATILLSEGIHNSLDFIVPHVVDQSVSLLPIYQYLSFITLTTSISQSPKTEVLRPFMGFGVLSQLTIHDLIVLMDLSILNLTSGIVFVGHDTTLTDTTLIQQTLVAEPQPISLNAQVETLAVHSASSKLLFLDLANITAFVGKLFVGQDVLNPQTKTIAISLLTLTDHYSWQDTGSNFLVINNQENLRLQTVPLFFLMSGGNIPIALLRLLGAPEAQLMAL